MRTKSTVDINEINKFATLSKQWWNKNGALKTLHDINPVRLQFIEDAIHLPQKTVLDVGCGGGILSEALAKKGAIVTGLDAEEEAIAVARKHAEKKQLALHYVATPIEDFTAQAFDVVVCMEMLEHVVNPQTVITHCARLLKPGGLLFLSTINRTLKAYAGAIVAAEYVLGLLPRQTHDFAKFIKPSELLSMARQEGFALKTMQGLGYNPFTRKAALQSSVDINYLVCCVKPCEGG
ncbi:MAG: bifunctional 2-polyprenyl-6-hydroxyphenol methylase/3-demethylubiquinol 3-O-methyltransferase UbiG [Tatlockia sp.]|jgi:2-polyprenyl-6-hydroxyphenyl methylase/3-demethylubiquinone-9 3-methyltransferase